MQIYQKTIIYLMVVILSATLLFSESNIKKLQNELESAKREQKGTLLIDLSRAYEGNNPDKVIEYASQALKIAEQIKSSKLKGLAFLQLSMGNLDLGEQDRAEDLLNKSLNIFDELENEFQQARVLNRLGKIFLLKSKYSQALENFREAMRIFQKEKIPVGISDCIGNIGIAYWYLGDYEKALKQYIECIIIDEKIGNEFGVVANLSNIAILYDNLKQFDKAEEYYFKAEKLYIKLNQLSGLSYTYNNLGDHFRDLKDYKKSLIYFGKSEKIALQLKDKEMLGLIYGNIASTYLKLKSYIKALENVNRAFDYIKPLSDSDGVTLKILAEIHIANGQYQKALKTLNKALENANKNNIITLKRDCFFEFSNIYKQLGNYKKTYDFYIKYREIKDQIFNEDSNLQITRMQIEYDTVKKEQEIELLKQNIEIQTLKFGRQKILRNAFIIGFILILIIFFLLLKKYFYFFSFWKKKNVIGHYKVIEKIASGGMGTVYKAKNLLDKTGIFAIKVMREELFEDETQVLRFKREASIIDQLDHPNIVKVIERGEYSGGLFMAMELLEGITLAEYIKKEQKPSIEVALKIMQQITDVISFIHKKSIIHKDLKPDNIILLPGRDGQYIIKLLDFGLALMQTFTRLTQTGMIMGTIYYLSPEQISSKEITIKSDIYSIGVIFYEMITGRKPFIGETSIDIMKQILDKEPLKPNTINQDIPLVLNNLILNMLEKKPENRPGSGTISETLSQI